MEMYDLMTGGLKPHEVDHTDHHISKDAKAIFKIQREFETHQKELN